MFSDWIKHLESNGTKLYEIADVIDVTYQTIQCYRDRNNYPTVKNLMKLSEHYNISIEEMLYFNESDEEKLLENILLDTYRKAPKSIKRKIVESFVDNTAEEIKNIK